MKQQEESKAAQSSENLPLERKSSAAIIIDDAEDSDELFDRDEDCTGTDNIFEQVVPR